MLELPRAESKEPSDAMCSLLIDGLGGRAVGVSVQLELQDEEYIPPESIEPLHNQTGPG